MAPGLSITAKHALEQLGKLGGVLQIAGPLAIVPNLLVQVTKLTNVRLLCRLIKGY